MKLRIHFTGIQKAAGRIFCSHNNHTVVLCSICWPRCPVSKRFHVTSYVFLRASDVTRPSQLEILPASSVSDKGRSSVQGTKPNANRTGPARGGTGSSVRQQAAGRALAALPKAIRFTSPNTADKSRAANRRQLVASARNVANDRWAAQLGYRDSREHIRDLK